MSDYIPIPESIDCSSISQLPNIDESLPERLSNDTLILVSQPSHGETETGYMSKYSRLETVSEYMSSALSVDDIYKAIDGKVDNALLSTTGTLSLDVERPYIISAIGVVSSLLDFHSLSGYRLSSGMQTEFNNAVFNIEKTLTASSIINDLMTRIVNIEQRMTDGVLLLEKGTASQAVAASSNNTIAATSKQVKAKRRKSK